MPTWKIGLLRCEALPWSEWFPTFRKVLVSSFSESNSTSGMRNFETLGTTHPTTQPHIPEDLHCQQHRCENLKFRKWREGSLKYAMAISFHFSPSSLFLTVRSFGAWLYGLSEKCLINEVLNCWYYMYIYIYLFMDELNVIRSGLLTALWTITATTAATASTTTTTTTTTTTSNNNNNNNNRYLCLDIYAVWRRLYMF